MATEILMPALSPTMEEGTLAKWLVGEGDAWILTAGQLIEARWSRPDHGSVTTFTVDGEPVGLTPGRTWVAVPQTGSGAGALAPEVAAQLTAWFR